MSRAQYLYGQTRTHSPLLAALGWLTACLTGCQDYALLEEDRLTAEVWSPWEDTRAPSDTADASPSDDLPSEPPDTRTGDGFRPDLPSEDTPQDAPTDTSPSDTPDTPDTSDIPDPNDPNPWGLSGPSLAVGWDHACAISRADVLTPGEVWCWGANDEAQLGVPDPPPYGTPQRVPTFTANTRQGAVAVTAGKGFSCALRADGTVWCWGDNREGQVGGGPMAARLSPTQADTQGTAWAVRAGRAHACALLGGGEVRCWGANTAGQLGDGTLSGGVTPRPVAGFARGAAQVIADGDVSCALRPERGGELWCWGADPRWRDRPPTLEPTLWVTNTTRASLGDDTACVWADDDITPRCVGRHPQAIQGVSGGSALDEPLQDPVEVSRLDGARSLTLTARTRCFLDRFGWPWCWGHNDQGQLGPDRADEASSLDPGPVALQGRASDLAISGLGTLCARLEPGDIWCWGSDAHGGLGRGPLPLPFDPTPAPVLGLPPP